MNNTDIAVNLVEIHYIEKMKEKLSLDDDISSMELRDRLFPIEWYDMDGETKLMALKEALDKNVLLSDTASVQKYCCETVEEEEDLFRALLLDFICGDDEED